MKKRIKWADVKFLTLCPRGKNRLEAIYKSEDDGNSLTLETLTKAGEEEGILTSLVCIPDHLDSDFHVVEAPVIEQICHSFAENGWNLDVRHDGKALDRKDACVVESTIVQKGDPRFEGFKDRDGNEIDPTGGWGTITRINNKELRKKYRDGEWDGMSYQGLAVLEPLEKSDGDDKVPEKDNDAVSREEFSKLSKSVEGLADGITKLLEKSEPEAKKEDKPKDKDKEKEKVVLSKADKRDPKKVEKYLRDLEADKLANDVDWDDPESVKAYHEELANVEKEEKEEPKGKRKATSNQSTKDVRKAEEEEDQELVTLTKEEKAGVKAGMELADFILKRKRD